MLENEDHMEESEPESEPEIEQEEGLELEEAIPKEEPKFVLVEFSRLIKLLQRCTECGRLPGGKMRRKARTIKWTKNGTNMTAIWKCSCVNNKRIRWATQNFIPGTKTRTGNISIVAASQVAPVSFPDLNSLCKAASIPFVSKRSYLSLSKSYVWPTVEDAYYLQKSDLVRSIPNPTNLSVDGNFDSPGFSAELCAVAGIEGETHQLLDFAVVHKSEVGNVSNRMELESVKILTSSIEKDVQIGEIIVDKHPQVCAYLRSKNYDYGYDPWHRLKNLKRELRSSIKGITNNEEKSEMKELARRFITHLYSSIERSQGDTVLCKELLYSFFLHIKVRFVCLSPKRIYFLGIHEWHKRLFTELIPVANEDEVCPRFKKEKFSTVTKCPHITEENHPNSTHQPVDPKSKNYQTLLALASKTQFMNDLDRIKYGKNTSFVESFWSVCIRYRPKRKYFPKKGFISKTQLAAIAFNENRLAELRGDRRVSDVYRCFSKAKGEQVTKIKKGPVNEEWKRKLVEESIERKRRQGPGEPLDIEPEDLYEDQDIIYNPLEEFLNFSDSEDEYEVFDD